MFNLKKIVKSNLIILIIGIFFAGFNYSYSADFPIYGWIWNEHIGWIDMGNNPASYGNNYQVVFKFNTDSDTGLYLSGSVGSYNATKYAFSQEVGWINFEGVSYDFINHKLIGEADVLLANQDPVPSLPNNAGGWNGKINLSGILSATGKGGVLYSNVVYNTERDDTDYTNADTITYLTKNCLFSGNAWGGLYTLGWLNIHNTFSFDSASGCRVPKITSFTYSQADATLSGGNDPVVRTVQANPVGSTTYTPTSGITLNWKVQNPSDIAYYELEASVVSGSISNDYKSWPSYSGFNFSHCLIDHTYNNPTTPNPSEPRNKELTDCDIRDDGIIPGTSSYGFIHDGSNNKDSKIQIKANGADTQSIKVYPVDLSGGMIKYTLKAYNKFGDLYTYDVTNLPSPPSISNPNPSTPDVGYITSNYSLTMRSWTNIRRNDNRTDVNVFSEIQDSPLDPGEYTFELCQHDDSDWSSGIPTGCTTVKNNTGSAISSITYKVSDSPSPYVCPKEDGCNESDYLTTGNLNALNKKDDPIVFEGIGIPDNVTVPPLGVYKVDVLMQYKDPSNPLVNFDDKARRNTIEIRNIGNIRYREISP